MITWPICVIAVNLYVHCPLKFLSRICNIIVNWYYYCLLVSPLSTGDTMSTGATIVYWCYHCLLAIPLSTGGDTIVFITATIVYLCTIFYWCFYSLPFFYSFFLFYLEQEEILLASLYLYTEIHYSIEHVYIK